MLEVRNRILQIPWMIAVPGIAIIAEAPAWNLLGDGLPGVLDLRLTWV